jgi:hypothetical protein
MNAARHAGSLRDAIKLAHQCGAPPLIERADDELAATGARPRKGILGGVDSVTASERRVAQLASQEMMIKAIAQELFVGAVSIQSAILGGSAASTRNSPAVHRMHEVTPYSTGSKPLVAIDSSGSR